MKWGDRCVRHFQHLPSYCLVMKIKIMTLTSLSSQLTDAAALWVISVTPSCFKKKKNLMVIIGTMGIGLQVLLYPRNIGKSSKSSGWILWARKVNCVFFQHLEFPAETAQGSGLRYSLSALTALNTVVYCISCWIANRVTAFSHLIPDLVCNQKLIWEVLHMTCVRTQA